MQYFLYYVNVLFLSRCIHIVILSLSFFLYFILLRSSQLRILRIMLLQSFPINSTKYVLHKILLPAFLILRFIHVTLIINYRQNMFFNNRTRLCSSGVVVALVPNHYFLFIKLWHRHTYTFLIHTCKGYLSFSRVLVFLALAF